MKYIILTWHIIKTIIILLVYLIIFPFYYLWVICKRQRYICIFSKELKKCGLDKDTIEELKLSTPKLTQIFNKKNLKTLSGK